LSRLSAWGELEELIADPDLRVKLLEFNLAAL
jgi:hypothetical protein